MTTSVSVVMPAFNAGRFIEDAMRSILNQSHRDLELIVVDDGSADETACVAQQLANEDARVGLVRAPNGGAPRAINLGMAEANNEWIAMMDADDLSVLTRMERQLAAAAEAPGVVGWGAYAERIDERGKPAGEVRHGAVELSAFNGAIEGGEIPYLLQGTLLVKRDAARTLGGYDEGLDQEFDLDFCARLSLIGPILVVPEVLYRYRIVSGSLSNNSSIARAREDRVIRINHRRRLAGKSVIEKETFLKLRGPRRWNEERRAWGHVLLVRGDAARVGRRWASFAIFTALGHACWPERPAAKWWRKLSGRLPRLAK